jgi:type VI secretion system protein ImpL
MTRKFKFDLLGILIVVILPGLLVWLRPQWLGLSAESRGLALAALCGVFLMLWISYSYDEASRATRAWRQVEDWVSRRRGAMPDASSNALNASSAPPNSTSKQVPRLTELKQWLADRNGWRWRWRGNWTLVLGEDDHVKRLMPELVEQGFAIAGSTVLIHAKRVGNDFDTAWFDEIRRTRRRGVDAVVALTHSGASLHSPFNPEAISQGVARISRLLRWAAPVYLIDVSTQGEHPSGRAEVVGLTWADTSAGRERLRTSLESLSGNLAEEGVIRLSRNARDRYAGELSRHIESFHAQLLTLVDSVAQSRFARNAVHGLLFVPLAAQASVSRFKSETSIKAINAEVTAHQALWETIASHSHEIYGRRVGFSFSSAAAWTATAAVALWALGTLISGATNRVAMQEAAATLKELESTQDSTQSLLALDALDKQLDTLETHRTEGAPWLTRFGLNHGAALLDALQPAYQKAASRVLIAPIQVRLEARLNQLASLSDAEIASGGNAQVQAAYDMLKTYLMLAHPEHIDAAFLTKQLLATNALTHPQNSSLTEGAWNDLREHAIAFYASHLKKDSTPAIIPDATLVASTRQTIIGVRGIQNSTDAIYQQIIEEATPKYPPITLATLLGDHPSRGLFNTTATIPGVFTRAAWDERIPKAIDEASQQHTVTGDWVLSDAKQTSTAPSTLKAELRQRYFDEYARAWAQFLNGIRWQNASSLSGTVDQLTLLGDPQRSPLVALMNAIVYHAGAGASAQSLSHDLIAKAQQWAGKDEKDPSKRAEPQRSQLATAFAPILRLTGGDVASNPKAPQQPQQPGDLSLPRYLERVTAMRLKTQQMMASPDPDAMSRVAAQAMLQGKTSDIADSRDYASRLAASLGEQWSGFGQLFEAPLEQTWQVIVQPASASLNEIWRTSILADWNRNFADRYPFADSDNDASLPDMARFMRLDNGVITQFVSTQLAGVIERQGDRWVAAQGANQGTLTLDPAFLAALNKLTRASTVMFPNGDARIRFDLRGVPTPGVTDMTFVLAGRAFRYFNQKDEWIPFEWPGQALENVTHVEWQTAHGGLRAALDEQGRFGLIRLLERARLTQQDSARYLLSWTPDQSQALPLAVQLRADAGAGPLDVLALRHFTLPARIFVTRAAKETQKQAIAPPPPLPPGALAAAAQLGVPLPHGKTTETR